MASPSKRNLTSDAQDDCRVYRLMVEGAAGHALFTLDPQGYICVWPAVAESLYGYESADIDGQQLDHLFADDRGTQPPLSGLLPEAKGGIVDLEGWHERADGSVFWASCTLSPLTADEFVGYVVVSRDRTSHKQYTRMLERQNDRLEEFTNTLSHDIRSPLSVVSGRLSLYRETGDEEHLDAIEETTDRVGRLVENLRRVARQGEVVEQPQPIDIDTLLETAREGTLPSTADLEYVTVPTVMGNKVRLVQLFENILRNSAEHGGADVTVRVGPLNSGFFIEDDGPGIPDADHKRAFDHGYSTRSEGTGYGLSVVRSIVDAHGWEIDATNATDGGARFEITGVEFVGD